VKQEERQERRPRARVSAALVGLCLSVLFGEVLLLSLDLPEAWLVDMAPWVANEGGLMLEDPELLFVPQAGTCSHCPGNARPWSSSPRSITVHQAGARRSSGTISKPLGTFRILAVGGSNTWGAETSDGENWPDLLEQRLNKPDRPPVEVWNFGVSGWETQQKVAALRRLIPQLSPDAVLLQVHNLGPRFVLEGADARAFASADSTLLDDWLPGIPKVGSVLRWLWERSRLLQLPTYVVERRRRAAGPEAGLPREVIRGTHERGLTKLRAWLDEAVRPSVILVVPPPGVQNQLAGALEDFEGLGLPMVELGGALELFAAEGRDIHPGPRVYSWYAEQIAQEVEHRWLR
jgi:hypothetical protein